MENIKNDITALSKVIRDSRKAAALSRLALATLADVSRNAIIAAEKGKPGLRLDTLLKILRALNIQIAYTPPLKKYENS